MDTGHSETIRERKVKVRQNTNFRNTEDENKYENDKKTSNTICNVNTIAFVIIIIAILLYMITLHGCHDSAAECLKNFDQSTIKYFAMALLISGFLFTSTFILAILRMISFMFPLATAVIIWFLCYVYDTGSDLKSHGAYNRVFLFAFMSASFVVQIIIVLIIFIGKKIGYVKVFTGLTILLLISGYITHHKLIASCNNWEYGLGGVKIDNEGPGCHVKKPKYCWMNLMDNVFDISGWIGENCEQIRMDSRQQVLRWTRSPKAKKLGYPRVEDWPYFPDSTINEFQFRVLANTVDMENSKVDDYIKHNTEIVVDYTKPNPEMQIDVKRDHDMAERRKKIRNQFKTTNFLGKNVVHLFIDSLSRDNFKRKLVKTHEILEKWYKNKSSPTRVYQFLKYHAIASWTLINMIPSMFGVDASYQGRAIHSNKYYKDKGFILGQAHNNCGREFYDMDSGNIEKFTWEQFDHEANPFSCDPNYTVPGHPFAIFNGPYGMKRRCLYGKDTSWYVFDYGKKFWKAYKDEPKYLRLSLVDAHEGTGEVAKYLDDKLVDFFNFLEEEGSFEDTIILLQSDHGVNMPGFYTFVDADDFWIEKTLPSFYLFVPQKVAEEFDETLSAKENVLLSPYDVHNTLLHLASAPKTSYNKIGSSLFMPITNIEARTCDQIGVVDSYCNCEE